MKLGYTIEVDFSKRRGKKQLVLALFEFCWMLSQT